MNRQKNRVLLKNKKNCYNQKIAFLFPGLGENYTNMCKSIFENELVFKEAMLTCSKLIKNKLAIDILDRLYPKAQDNQPIEHNPFTTIKRNIVQENNITFNDIVYNHLVTFIVEYSLTALLKKYDIYPDMMLGCSLGEYVACCVSGCLSLEDTVDLIIQRAELIEKLPPGIMLAVLAPKKILDTLLTPGINIAIIGDPLFNIVAGNLSNIDLFVELLNKNEIISTPLQVTHPLHSQYMLSLYQSLVETVNTLSFKEGKIPYISNVTGLWVSSDQFKNSNYFSEHICSPVQLTQGIETLIKQEALFFEVGPGTGLSNLTLAIGNTLNLTPSIFNLMQHRLVEEDSHIHFLEMISKYQQTNENK